MNLLAIDTATPLLSVALAAGTDTWCFEADAGLRHSEIIMDSIDMLMKTAALKPEDLSGVVCMGGPGSFTGLRIGFALAKGLALSLGIPFAPIPTLDCMARPFAAWPGIAVPVIDARKNAFFCALYRSGVRMSPAMDAAPGEIANAIASVYSGQGILLVGPDAEKLYHAIMHEASSLQASSFADAGMPGAAVIPGTAMRWGNARTLLEIAAETHLLDSGGADYTCGPEYIRKSDAELSAGQPPA